MGSKPEGTVLLVELNKDEYLDSKIVRLQKGWILRFVCGRELLGKYVKLSIKNAGTIHIFPELRNLAEMDEKNHFDYYCNNFGAFSYEFFLTCSSSKEPVGRGYFCVVPEWNIAGTDRLLSLNGLSVITHLTKLLGPLSEWTDRLRVAKEAGYNVVHLTPVQRLGISNSSYSVADFHQLNPAINADFPALEAFVHNMESEWHMLTIQDVVWNHAAKNATWLQEHPECAFNCENSPHLRPAYIVDRALFHFSREIANGKWESRGLPALIDNDNHLGALKHILETEIFPALRLHEFFQIDVEKYAEIFRHKASTTPPVVAVNGNNVNSAVCQEEEENGEFNLVQDPEYRRFGSTVDIEKCLKAFNLSRNGSATEEQRISKCCEAFRTFLNCQNSKMIGVAESHVSAAVQATLGHVHYERVAGHGVRRGVLSEDSPLVTNYFLHLFTENGASWQKDERLAYSSDTARYLMACNGWVMNADPLVNFAEPPSQVYLRRELVCWGDCVKLNYGRSPADCPYLWKYMREYTEMCARTFHGFRIDNCHSTPIHVAEYLLHAARQIRHNLYVVAELFTGNESLDNLFVNRLGITSLVRECQNAPDSHEQGRFVHRYGGDPVGAFRSKTVRPAPFSVAHALFYDQTHDNPSPYHKRTAYDYVPTAAMTAMAYCASGTTRGYDEFVSYHIDVVHEKRPYSGWSELCADASLKGMVEARRLFNDLHASLAENGYSEIFVDQVNADIVAITRHNPLTHESVLLISHCCFSEFKWTPECRGVDVADDIVEILFEVKTVEDKPSNDKGENLSRIGGLTHFRVEIYEHVALNNSLAVDVSPENSIRFKLFTSGSVIAFKIQPKPTTKTACVAIEKTVADETLRDAVIAALRHYDLQDFNYLLFRCEPEERAASGSDAFDVPGFGKLVYCGLQGVYTTLRRIQATNDLGHPLCGSLRGGTWLCHYLVGRLRRVPKMERLAALFGEAFGLLDAGVLHFLRPCYFELLFSYLYSAVQRELDARMFAAAKLSRLSVTEQLAHSAVSFVAAIPSAELPIIAANRRNVDLPSPPSLAAGLPHFAEGIWRNWGRDTFIALPGVLLLNGRFAEARDVILAFAGTLRHGLIPNLLAEGKAARYNCRDAVWFWLAAILQYVELAPRGVEILAEPVLRLYPTDEAGYLESEKLEPLHATMYEALRRHVDGIEFRERNAGNQIDEHMTDQGFNIRVYIDRETGLVHGGNAWNCGTWMDKMGSSDRAGNRGQPATPRDGAAVELQGLAVYVAERLAALTDHDFPYATLTASDGSCSWTWTEWALKLRVSFAEKFYVRDECTERFVNRRGIVKDSVGSSAGFTDFQLRPNFCVALAMVPDILESEQAWRALEIAGNVLLGPLGIRTLDPEDWAYNGDYNNDDDGTNKQTAKGWNYHQGPEWLWLAGVYLNAKLKVGRALSALRKDSGAACRAAIAEVLQRTDAYARHMNADAWGSLPELTNRNGTPCPHSCPAQAWSVGCFTEVLHTLGVILATND